MCHHLANALLSCLSPSLSSSRVFYDSPANGPGGALVLISQRASPHLKQHYNHTWHAILKGKRQQCGRQIPSLAWQCEIHKNEASDIFQRIIGLTRANPCHLDSQNQFSTWSSFLDFWFKRMGFVSHLFDIFRVCFGFWGSVWKTYLVHF